MGNNTQGNNNKIALLKRAIELLDQAIEAVA
jgi:hypothetical protein